MTTGDTMSNLYDPNLDSKQPFLKNNISAAGSSTGVCGAGGHNGNASNGNNTAFSNGLNDGSGAPKLNNRLDDYQSLQSTVAKLRVWLFAITGVAIAGFVILIIVVTCLYATLNYDLTHHNHKPKIGEQMAAILEREELCVPCEDFLTGPSPQELSKLNRFTMKDTDTGGRDCCVDQPLELLELLKLHIEKRFRQEMAKGTMNRWDKLSRQDAPSNNSKVLKPAAHLMYINQDMTNVAQVHGRQYTIGKWLHDDDIAFTYQIDYRHGRLVIPEDGHYYIYSQISFIEMFDVQNNEAYGSRNGPEGPSLSHYLYRYNILYHNGGEEKLAQNSITKCWGQSKTFGEYTSNLGAVFYLRNADEIFIKVSNISMISSDPKLSYFGLFKV
uniref:THD domain-containing protein n=1 Tax=Biomphalaria glabrata TaxID=6526 RepID=A0A2C9K817_BIOGL